MTPTLIFTGAATAATAVLGGLASSDVNSPWYAELDKPAFQPPGYVFPIAWTALYCDIALTSAQVIDRLHADGRSSQARAYSRALGINLALNASWSWVFFRFHKLGPAVVVAGALAASSADLTRRAGQAGIPTGVAPAPYAGWCSLATVLSGELWRRNRPHHSRTHRRRTPSTSPR